MFDEYLRQRAERTGEPFVAFDSDSDYGEYVDGKPRYDGVRSFLASRGIELPEGEEDDPPTAETVHGLGNRKNELVLKMIREDGVEAYPGSVRYLEAVRDAGSEARGRLLEHQLPRRARRRGDRAALRGADRRRGRRARAPEGEAGPRHVPRGGAGARGGSGGGCGVRGRARRRRGRARGQVRLRGRRRSRRPRGRPARARRDDRRRGPGRAAGATRDPAPVLFLRAVGGVRDRARPLRARPQRIDPRARRTGTSACARTSRRASRTASPAPT